VKLKITKGINRFDMSPTFNVYKWETTQYDREGRWGFLNCYADVEKAREFVALQIKLGDNPPQEELVEEFEG
jgi:hypothetical protein